MTTAGALAYETRVRSGDAAYVWAGERTEPMPLVVLVHGSHVHPKHYSRYACALAADGFVVVAPEHVRELFGERAHYPQQAVVNWAIDWAREENEREDSPLHGRIDTTSVFVVGHSMGGGVALGVCAGFGQPGLVVDDWSTPEELRAVVVHGTHNIPPPRTGDPLPIDARVPLAFVQGSADGVVTVDQAERTFAAVRGDQRRMFVTLTGANHFGVTDDDNPEGVNADPSPGVLDQAQAIASAARWSALWFRASVGDTDAEDALQAGPRTDEPHVSVLLSG